MTVQEKRERVIQGLKVCIPAGCGREKCPYYEGPESEAWGNPDGYRCEFDLRQDAIALLEAQEPRVMTWDELIEWHRTDPVKREPIFVEYKDEAICGPSRWHVVPFGLGALDEGTKRIYNKYARCWTSRPDNIRRIETLWN